AGDRDGPAQVLGRRAGLAAAVVVAAGRRDERQHGDHREDEQAVPALPHRNLLVERAGSSGGRYPGAVNGPRRKREHGVNDTPACERLMTSHRGPSLHCSAMDAVPILVALGGILVGIVALALLRRERARARTEAR